jgi:hypothetical protein
MSVRKEFTTKSGLTLPLLNLKGKEYLLAAHRIQWFVHENNRFIIKTEMVESVADVSACVKAIITVHDENNNVIKSVEGVKTEHKKQFEDYIEKATTGAISRALSYIGYGTQFSGDELNELVNERGEEVNRLADAPLAKTTKKEEPVTEKKAAEPVKKAGFGVKKETTQSDDGWN